MADIATGSLYMAAADKAAVAIEQIINTQVGAVIDQCVADGTITQARAIKLKKRGAKVGANVVELVIGFHDDLIQEAKDADVDLPPPADGTAALVEVVQNMVSVFGSGGR